jgi:hypothetical protein
MSFSYSLGQFHKYVTWVTYSPAKISCTVIHCMHCFQNALAYFVLAVSYGHKMFTKLTPVKYVQLQSNVGTIKMAPRQSV